VSFDPSSGWSDSHRKDCNDDVEGCGPLDINLADHDLTGCERDKGPNSVD
jgi:hypothetical protein